MPTGLAMPPGVDSRGHARVVSGPAQTEKLLVLHTEPGDSTNPFEQIGIPNAIFSVADEGATMVRAYIEEVFGRFQAQGRGKLLASPTVAKPAKPYDRSRTIETPWQSLEESPRAPSRTLRSQIPIGGNGR